MIEPDIRERAQSLATGRTPRLPQHHLKLDFDRDRLAFVGYDQGATSPILILWLACLAAVATSAHTL